MKYFSALAMKFNSQTSKPELLKFLLGNHTKSSWKAEGRGAELKKIIKIPEDLTNLPLDHLSPKFFSTDLVNGTNCKSIVKKINNITTP